VPYSEQVRPPGPFTPAARVKLAGFSFETEGRRQLSELLTKASPALGLTCSPPIATNADALAAAGLPIPDTPAQWITAATEMQIRLLLSAQKADPNAAPGNPANNRAAIRRLRRTLKPFVAGWVDPKTAEIRDWGAIDADLAQREAELAAIKRPAPYERRELQYNLRVIADSAAKHALMAGVALPDDTILRFIHAALSLANIKLPHPDERPARLRNLVFGEVRLRAAPSPSEG
jgi:hypothetical protein